MGCGLQAALWNLPLANADLALLRPLPSHHPITYSFSHYYLYNHTIAVPIKHSVSYSDASWGNRHTH
jgi:hypothetical protein